MLGRLHTSDDRNYIPHFSRVVVPASSNTDDTFWALDWDHVDKYKQKEYTDSNNEHWPNARIDGVPGTLPEEFDTEIKSLVYQLPAAYRRSIEHFTSLFLLERNANYPFDTCIRDGCMRVSHAAINTAFFLLSDCIVDPNTGSWYRNDKQLVECKLRYKFWRLYTGRGLVFEFAGHHRLERWSELSKSSYRKGCGEASSYAAMIDKYLARILEWEVEQEEKFWGHQQCCEVSVPSESQS